MRRHAGITALCAALLGCAGTDPAAAPSPSLGSTTPPTTAPAAAGDATSATPAETTAGGDAGAGTEASTASTAGTAGTCPAPAGPAAGDAVELTVLSPGDASAPRVEAAVYPRSDYEGNPWSQWGQGVVLPDGRFLSAIGDHLGADGNSYFFEYDPAAGTLTRFSDVLSLVDHQAGAWGYGKIHAPLVLQGCTVYAGTYWGSRRNLEYGNGYEGDLLLAIDPASRTITSLGAPLPGHGIPSLAGAGDLLYGEAPDGTVGENDGPFFVYDTAAGEVVFESGTAPHTGFRSIAVDADGTAFVSAGGGRLSTYEPGAAQLGEAPGTLPGDWLRAATSAAPDGTVYGATRDPDALFALAADGSIRPLGEARGYVASLALDPAGALYYVPDAHGGAWQTGTPVIRVDTSSGADGVLVELNPLAEEMLGLRLGGSYDVVYDGVRRVLYVGANAGDPAAEDEDASFGEVVLLVVTLP